MFPPAQNWGNQNQERPHFDGSNRYNNHDQKHQYDQEPGFGFDFPEDEYRPSRPEQDGNRPSRPEQDGNRPSRPDKNHTKPSRPERPNKPEQDENEDDESVNYNDDDNGSTPITKSLSYSTSDNQSTKSKIVGVLTSKYMIGFYIGTCVSLVAIAAFFIIKKKKEANNEDNRNINEPLKSDTLQQVVDA
ncbi:hypothetical protein TRFO_20096 [Tritrichomonas foetus]|uniref:Uncharacterized protein n=1 Tax=Tritrichomonas foetus TaxID=1144522 RepID=A0A1J4KLM0_9EUKA|nr:hypothetical protein TRFO_20096 [Tritrichomonas foetus]|eukprot:OHT10590.1 hypothetical protein TRFO_20096 [Tritrichomonas foetus]